MNGGFVGARVADGEHQFELAGATSIEKTFREVPLRFFGKPSESLAANAFGLKGFQFAADNADEAAAILVSENPGVFDANKDLPKASQEFLDEGHYLVDANGVFGTQTLERWTGYSKFLYDQGLLVGVDKKPLAAPLDYAKLFTTDFSP